jgi:UDP:flavonoid glycosyltransferase YjiC (YdhE family)
VTQGTVANADFDALLFPTIDALADLDVLVVGSTGGRDIPQRALPANARIARYLPYDRLLPRTDVFVTNGGYGGVHYALEHGVPIISTGNTEDKAEVSARVEWSGAGLRLRPGARGAVSSSAIRGAVQRVLEDGAFRTNARRIGEAIAASPGPAGLDAVIRSVRTEVGR